MKQIKRFLSLALTLALVLSCMPATVLAADTTPALPTATVRPIAKDDLTFALNFKADTVTEEQLAYYGNWYADFELTVNKKVTLNNDGSADGYLAGQYDDWSYDWITVPYGKYAPVTLEANKPLKIMAFAAESMEKPGLKYTFAEVYDRVKDFDCGVFFDAEFLAANPDLVVTLELKMYNPANEAENYVIGETYTFGNPAVAKNTTTGKVYTSVNAAMMDCTAGQTVILMKNAAEMIVSVFEDATLDLNGYTLTASYVTSFGDIIDSSEENSGLLDVPANRLMLQEDNAQLPIRDAEGYHFAEVITIVTAMANANTFAFQFRVEPYFLEMLKAGAEISGVDVQVLVSWKDTKNGGYRVQSFVYNDTMVQKFLNSYKPAADSYGAMFTLSLANAANYEELTFEAVLVSNTGVTFAS